MKVIDKIIVSPTAPKNKNAAWFDGKSIKMPSQGKWESAGGSGGGIEIVESVDKLDPNAPVGSVAVIAEKSSIQENSVLDLPQPDASIINMDTFIIDASGCPQALGISIIIPQSPIDVSTSLTESEMLCFASSEVDLIGDTYGVVVGILPVIENSQIVGLSGMYKDASTKIQKQWSFFAIQNGAVEINQDAIDECNSYINGLYYIGAISYAMQDMVLSQEQLEVYDKVLKVEVGTPSKAYVYLKSDKWQLLNNKDINSLRASIDKNTKALESKSDVILVEKYSSYRGISPNVYTTHTNTNTSVLNFYLKDAEDTARYNEYIIELKCNQAPSSITFKSMDSTELTIKWANDMPPAFEKGYTYLISIVNSFGVYSMFPNS